MDKNKVLLINPLSQNSLWENDIIARQPPCGLLYLASYLRKNGYDVGLYERKFALGYKPRERQALTAADDDLCRYLRDFKPDIIGITATTSQVMDAFHCAQLAKGADEKMRIIFGGPHASAEPELSLRQCQGLDAVCIGEGENVMLEFASGVSPGDIKGLSFRSDGRIKTSEKRDFIRDLDSIPFPAWDLLRRDFYFSPNSTTIKGVIAVGTTVFSVRGCPYSCYFCQNSVSRESNAGTHVRHHSVDYVKRQILFLLENYRINAVFFDDPVFAAGKKHVLELCRMFIESGLHKKIFFQVNLRADTVDRQMLEALKEAGCKQIIYGVESGSSKVLARMNKKTDIKQGIEAMKLTKKYRISCIANFVLGNPQETEDEFMETVGFIKKTKPDWVTRHKLYPLPGTVFYKQLLSEGKIDIGDDWDKLYDHYVLGENTFADMTKERFKYLCLVLDRTLAIPIDYLFRIRSNIKKKPVYALRQFFLMITHVIVLYLPEALRIKTVRLAEILRLKSKYVYE